MESLLKPMKLSPDFNRVLEEIRDGAENALYGAVPAASEELFQRHVESLIEGAGLPSLQVIHYRWYLREIARLWRTRRDRDLAFHLELCIRKWVNLGLEPRTLQFLICEAHQRLKGCQPPTADRQPLAAPPLNSDLQPLTPDIETAKAAKVGTDSTTGAEQSVESAKSVDVLSGSASASTPTPGPQPLTPDIETAKDAKFAKAEPGSSDGTEQSVESVKSVDVRSGTGPDTGILESSTPGTLR